MDRRVVKASELPLPLVLNSSLPPNVVVVGVPSTVATMAAAVRPELEALEVVNPENWRLPSAKPDVSSAVGATDVGFVPLDRARVIVAPPSVPESLLAGLDSMLRQKDAG